MFTRLFYHWNIHSIHCPCDQHHLVFCAFELTVCRITLFILIFICIILLNLILGLYYFIHEICWYIIRLGWRRESICFFFIVCWRLISAIAHVGHCHVSNCLLWPCFSGDLHFLFCLFHFLLMLIWCLMTFCLLAREYSSVFTSVYLFVSFYEFWTKLRSVSCVLWINSSAVHRRINFVPSLCDKKWVFSSLIRYIGLFKKSSVKAHRCCFCLMKEGRGQKD